MHITLPTLFLWFQLLSQVQFILGIFFRQISTIYFRRPCKKHGVHFPNCINPNIDIFPLYYFSKLKFSVSIYYASASSITMCVLLYLILVARGFWVAKKNSNLTNFIMRVYMSMKFPPLIDLCSYYADCFAHLGLNDPKKGALKSGFFFLHPHNL